MGEAYGILAPLKPLLTGLVLLSALAVASVVASGVANQALDYAGALGWWTLAMVAWPVFLFVGSRYY